MNNEYFKVFGEKKLLNRCKINLKVIDEIGNEHIYNILCNGKVKDVKAENEAAVIYKFYFSYNDHAIEVLKTENIFRNASDQVNNLYIEEKDGIIYVKFIGRKSDIENNENFRKMLIDKNKYFELYPTPDNNLNQIDPLFFICQ